MTHPYIPDTGEDVTRMLEKIGVPDVDSLFADIPTQHLDPGLDLPEALSEMELMRTLNDVASKNTPISHSFLGAGAYTHHISPVVNAIISRGEYLTAYTPYQPEISQGTLQTTWEFQTLVCELTGMEMANAGMYDGASAMAEACLMACSVTGRDRIVLSSSLHPNIIETVKTYAFARGLTVEVLAPGAISPTDQDACVGVQNPDFFGYWKDLSALGKSAEKVGALFVVSVEPVSLGLFQPPTVYGADIVVGDGQPLATPPNFGGPYVGLFACRSEYQRKMPGRIVGRTKDLEGKTAYVLTLQTREQHIRREKATSNICTSTQLVALAFTVQLCLLGKQGLRQLAELCYHKAHYAADRIAEIDGFSLPVEGEFFQEFVISCPIDPAEINRRLLKSGIIGGYDVSNQIESGLLVCFSELHYKEDIDQLVLALKEATHG